MSKVIPVSERRMKTLRPDTLGWSWFVGQVVSRVKVSSGF